MRILGLIMLCICPVAAGFLFACKLTDQHNRLLAAVSLTQRIKSEISYNSLSLPLVFKRLCTEEKFMPFHLDEFDFATGFPVAIKKYFEINSGVMLNQKANEILKEFLNGLGTSDKENQLRHCDIYTLRFKSLLEEFEQEYKSRKKLIYSLGIYAGLALFVILF